MRILVLFLFLCTTIYAESYDPQFFTNLHWRLIGPFRAGRVLTVTGIPEEPDHFYFGAVNGGVWETNDAGRTWHPIFDDMPIASIGAIAIAPSNPKVIYVGSGEADMRSDIGYGNGMYKSPDGGRTWKHIGLTDSHQIGKILIDPKNENVVFVAALGHAYGASSERGVFRSKDGGVTWQKVLYKDADTGAIDLAFGESAQTVYATLWRTRRPPWNVYPPSKGPGSGLYKSTDGGMTWTQTIGHGFPTEHVGRIGIGVAKSDPETLYALVDADAGGVYRSDDSGANWKRMTDEKRLWQRGWYFGGITVDPKNPEIVFACNTAMYKSTDGGKRFVPFRGSPGGDDYHELWIDPNEPDRMITGADQGAIITVNAGKTWSSWYNQPTGQFYHVITDNSFPYLVYGAQQDSGAAAVPSRSDSPYSGINMTNFREITAGGENGFIAPDPFNPQIIYGGTVEKLDRSSEQTSNIDPTFAYPGIYRSEWTLPLTFSPHNRTVLYFANQYLFRTSDGGKHWSTISEDMTRNRLSIPPNLDSVTANEDTAVFSDHRAVIYSIAPSPLRDGLIWIGTDDGLVWRTDDEGAHWRNVTPDSITAWSKIGIIEASHFDPQTAYLAVDRHRIDDYKPYIYRTLDGGKSWQPIMDGIPEGHFVNVVREDPKKKGLLYAGTELAVYVSFDDGDQWQSLQLNLPPSSIRDINVHENDLVIGTHGRAFWIMDDISPLRQFDVQIFIRNAWLFEPARGYRIHVPRFTATPFPRDEPVAPNPPPGIAIDYYLKNDSSSLTLDIFDANGQLVRRYSSTDKVSAYDINKIIVTPDWFPDAQILSAKAGVHRLIWDLHYTFPETLREEESKDGTEPQGRWALPGHYVVKLKVNGETYTQKVTVKNDPRVKITQRELQQQFALATQIQAERVRLMKAVAETKQLLKNCVALRARASEKLASRLVFFEEAITDQTEIRSVSLEQAAPGSYPMKTTSFLYLNSALKTLETSLEGVDGVSPDAIASFHKLVTLFRKSLNDWETFKKSRLPELNAALQRENLPVLQ